MEENNKETVIKISKSGKMKMIGVWVPNDFNYLASITGGPLITYDMAARMLNVKKETLKFYIKKKKIKVIKNTMPGLIRASEIMDYINKKEQEKSTFGFAKRPKDTAWYKRKQKHDKIHKKGYSEDEIRTIEARVYNPHSLKKRDDGELRQQEI